MNILESEKGRFRDPIHRYFATCNPTDLDIMGGLSVNATSAYKVIMGIRRITVK